MEHRVSLHRKLTMYDIDLPGLKDGPAVSGYDDKTAAGDWHSVPKRTLKPTIVDPYVYPVNGVNVLMTTVATPMIVNGRFIVTT